MSILGRRSPFTVKARSGSSAAVPHCVVCIATESITVFRSAPFVARTRSRSTKAIFFRLSREFVLVLHLQHGSGLHPNYRRRITPSIAKFGFTRDWIRYRYERDWRACLGRFRKYAVLSTCGGDKQPDARQPAERICQFLQNLHRETYRWVSASRRRMRRIL